MPRPCLLLFASLLFACVLSLSSTVLAQTAGEVRAQAALAEAAKNPQLLRAFLWDMPKGGELHFHITGAVYAETILRNAAEDNLCVKLATQTLAPNTGMTKSEPPVAVCPAGLFPASIVNVDNRMRDEMIDSWSMRAFVPFNGHDGHDQFFTSGKRVGIDPRHFGEWLDEVVQRASAQNEQYMEIMANTSYAHTEAAVVRNPWTADTPEAMAALRQALLPSVLEDMAPAAAELDRMEATRRQREACDSTEPQTACKVLVRYLVTVSRENRPAHAFAQMLFNFELASRDPRVVGVNIAQPEDGALSMSEYHRQMQMFAYLHGVYPKVHLSLHAGELSFGMVPPEGIRFHIREAVELAHAERIGHGVDVMDEDNARQLLQEMAARHVMVEINITSNDYILGITGAHHPLPLYLAAHVPVALSTDDEGVSRIDLTHEYARAVSDFGLHYIDLKRSARTALEHAFVEGQSLWKTQDNFTTFVSACTSPTSATCAAFLRSNTKARLQMELEDRFHTFESSLR
jgi:adenosine deaminase